MPDPRDDEKRLRLRYAGVCRICGTELPARAAAVYERTTKTVRCVEHDVVDGSELSEPETLPTAIPELVDPGVPGASARREFERRRTAREDRIRSKHRKLGGLILAVSEAPQSTNAWDTGALGEERLGVRLNELATDTFRVLHDRRIPKSRANIDHLATTPSGVFVIDAKKYKGRPQLQIEGGILRPCVEKLIVGKRDRSSLVDGVLKQVKLVREIVGPEVPVTGVLCFVEAEWPLIGGAFSTRGSTSCGPRGSIRRSPLLVPLTLRPSAAYTSYWPLRFHSHECCFIGPECDLCVEQLRLWKSQLMSSGESLTVWDRLREYAATQSGTFTSQEALSWFRRHSPSQANDRTVRTHIRGACWNVGDRSQFSKREPFLTRVDRGVFRLATVDEIDQWRHDSNSQQSASDPAPRAAQDSSQALLEAAAPNAEPQPSSGDWHTEAHVQALLVTALATDGWRILSVANTATKEHGIDVIASKESQTLGVEVKGFPSRTYADPARSGEQKPAAQAPKRGTGTRKQFWPQ